MKTILFFLPFFLSLTTISQVQFSRDVIGSSGGNVSNSQIQFDFTLGEVFTNTLINIPDDKIQTNGFQQPNKGDQIIISVSEQTNDDFALYPNPSSKSLVFKCENYDQFPYTIFDQNFKLVLEGNIVNGEAEVDVSKLESGTYYFIYPDRQGSAKSISFIINKTE